MPTIDELQPLLGVPREDLAAEYKTWLDLTTTEHKAVLAKAAIALANHGGGFIVVGFNDDGPQLLQVDRPEDFPEVTQDQVNTAIRRFATPEFHCRLYNIPHPTNRMLHPIIVVPGGMMEPVMSKRDCNGVISKNRCYIRKPGPRSEEPQTVEEWRALLQRCIQAGREDMLDAIRTIVTGRIEAAPIPPDAAGDLHAFCEAARARWSELADELPEEAPARFPLGHYEMGFSLIDAQPAPNLQELQSRLDTARKIKLTGWTVFLSMGTRGWEPYPHEEFVEAWVGRQIERDRSYDDAAHADFWRASRDGKLYTIRGYTEDSRSDRYEVGAVIDVTLPVWRVGEGLLFASRLAEAFEDVEAIAVECRFTGLDKRLLTGGEFEYAISDKRVSHTDQVTLTGQATIDQIRDNLTEFVHDLMSPLYERFHFFNLPVELVDRELGRLRGGRF